MGEEAKDDLLSSHKPQHFPKMERLHHTILCIVLDGSQSNLRYFSLWTISTNLGGRQVLLSQLDTSVETDPETLSDLSRVHSPIQNSRSQPPALVFFWNSLPSQLPLAPQECNELSGLPKMGQDVDIGSFHHPLKTTVLLFKGYFNT